MVNRQERRRDRDDDRRSGGFKYQKRDAKSLKDRAEQRGGSFDSIFKSGVDTFRPRVGKNTIRILPPTWKDADHYGYDVYVHSYVGPDSSTFLCLDKMLNKRCPICEEAREAKADGETEEAKALGVKKAVLMYVLDREEDDNKPLVWQISWSMDKDIAAIGADNKTGKVLDVDHPDKGFDLFFNRNGQGKKTKYNGHAFDRETSPMCEREKDQDEVIEFIEENPIPELLEFKSEEYLEKVMSGTSSSKDKETDDDDDGDDRGSRRRSRDDDDEGDSRSSRRRARDDDDDKGRDDDDGDDRRGSRRGRDDDDDDDNRGRGSRRGRDDDDDDKGKDDDGDKSSRRRNRDDDDDDRGSRRRSRDDDDDKGKDDDDDKGSRRRSRDDDDDEGERPRGRTRIQDDDDDDKGKDDDDDKSERRSSRRGRDDDDDEGDKGSSRRGSRRGR
jgi:hypothetical protein